MCSAEKCCRVTGQRVTGMGGALLHMVAREGSSIKVTWTEVGQLIRWVSGESVQFRVRYSVRDTAEC